MRILIVTNVIPYPPISGGALRLYNLLKRVAKQHEVWLAAHLHTPQEAEGVPHLRKSCRHVATGILRRRHPLIHLLGLLRYALSGWPLELKFRYCKELVNKIRRLFSEVDFDIVQIEESGMALYQEIIPPAFQGKRILTFYDIDFKQTGRISRVTLTPIMKWRTWLYSLMMERWEPRYAERFDRCITVSEVDRHLLLGASPRLRINVIPNGVDTQVYQPLPQQPGSPALLFVGSMDFPPSGDGVLFFCDEILPRIWRMVPDVQMWIVGRNPPPKVMQLNGNRVHVTGRVEDIRPYYNHSTVCVVPLRAGGGTRLKILEAMALGRPIVSTTMGCEGLDVIDREHVLIADSPEQFAEKTVRLITDRALYQRITTNARRVVVARYDWDMIAEQLMQLYAEMVA